MSQVSVPPGDSSDRRLDAAGPERTQRSVRRWAARVDAAPDQAQRRREIRAGGPVFAAALVEGVLRDWIRRVAAIASACLVVVGALNLRDGRASYCVAAIAIGVVGLVVALILLVRPWSVARTWALASSVIAAQAVGFCLIARA